MPKRFYIRTERYIKESKPKSVKCRLSNIDEVLEEWLETNGDYPHYSIIECEEHDYQICVEDIVIEIPELGIAMREGSYDTWEEDEHCYIPDFTISIIYEKGADKKDYLYWEQGALESALHNYVRMRKDLRERLQGRSVYELECEIKAEKEE